MNINDFLVNFSNQLDETEPSEIKADSVFRNFDEWSSLTGLSVLNMVEKKYKVTLTFDEMRRAVTVQDLYNIIKSKI